MGEEGDAALLEEEVNRFYEQNFSSAEANLAVLETRIGEEFFVQETRLADQLLVLEAQRAVLVGQLEGVEAEYDRLLEANAAVFAQITAARGQVEEFESARQQHDLLYANLKALEAELAPRPAARKI